ncbi:MAG: ATP synthase F1 subunit epsilon [Rubrobacteraceae bacterium]
MADDGRQLFCRVITPQETVFDDEVSRVIARIHDGEIGVLVDHAPTISTIEIGDVRILQGDETLVYATSDGFFKVSENLVQILVEEAIPAEEIDVDEAGDRVEKAEQELSELGESEDEEEELDRRRRDIERRRSIGENYTRVARKYGEG